MIRPRTHLFAVERDVQNYDTRYGLLRLDMNEYLPYAHQKLYELLHQRLTPELMSSYPLVNEAYHAVSHLIQEPENKIVLTNGSDGAIFMVLQAFCDPGDLVGYIAPAYGMYGVYCAMLNLPTRVISYNHQMKLDHAAVLDAITPEMKVMMIANPNGVLGTVENDSFLLELIRKGNQTGTVILIDEVHADFQDKGHSRFAKYTNEYDNLVIARSFSKSYGIAGVRAGFALAHKDTRRFLISVRNNVEINAVAVEAIRIWCSHPELMRECVDEIAYSRHEQAVFLQSLGMTVKEGGGNFILAAPSKDDYPALRHFLHQRNIAVKYLGGDYEGWLRITVGTREYMRSFQDAFREYYGG